MTDFVNEVGNMDFQKVTLDHGEYYRQRCLDRGNRAATVAKKLRHLKLLFQLAVIRKQLDENPLQHIKMPKSGETHIRTFNDKECSRILKAAFDYMQEWDETQCVRWDLLIPMALMTALRRGELLNATWPDIDFDAQTIEVSPKETTTHTWLWLIKDSDERTLPLSDDLTEMLVRHQNRQPEGYPYVFVPPRRYEAIQELRRKGEWKFSDSRLKVVNNFSRQFKLILQRASVGSASFHDFRRTALSNMFASGLTENDVMKLAGHSNFNTTHQFYLDVADGLVERARQRLPQSQLLVRAGARGLFEKSDSHNPLPDNG